MEKLTAAICEDNPQSLHFINKEMERAFCATGEEIAFCCFTSAPDLLKDIRSGAVYDILFLDIDMPEMNGIDLCKILRREDYPGLIIFISNKEALVFETFQVQPFRFVRKNHFSQELQRLVSDIVQYFRERRDITLQIKEQHSDKIYSLSVLHIQFIEVIGKYCKVVTQHHETVIRYPLTEFEKLLRPYGFLLPHRSYLVNYRCIFSIEKSEIRLDSGEAIPLSRNRRDVIKDEYLLLNTGGTLK